MKCCDVIDGGCDYHFIENKDGLIEFTLHRIIIHPKTANWTDRRKKQIYHSLVAVLEKTKKEKKIKWKQKTKTKTN